MTAFPSDVTYWSAFVASFAASLVEFVEALTIVMAVGTGRGWRYALSGAAGGAVVLIVTIPLFGSALAKVPLGVLHLVIGTLLLLFGMRWLRKAALRAAGLIPMHDEALIYDRETAELLANASAFAGGWDLPATLTALQAVVLEGLEVAFIVLAVAGAGRMLIPACAGAASAGAVVIMLGLLLHRPLARVPENTLKFVVGAILSTFGAFWVGEGLGFQWPGGDRAILALLAAFLAVGFAAIALAQRQARFALATNAGEARPEREVRS
jgi:uncharacterized membrane protein